MPDDWACDLYEPGHYRERVEVETVIQGEVETDPSHTAGLVAEWLGRKEG